VTKLEDLELCFVTGKGGTGKTTVAAALARYLAGLGKRVLLCEVDAKGEVALVFEASEVGFTPKEVAPSIWAMTMDTESSLKEYLKIYLKVPVTGPLSPLAKAFDFVATAAPGVKEILTVGKVCFEVRQRTYDVVVVDAPATGHIIGQLAAPQAINELVKVGLIRSQTEWMLEILSDRSRTGVVVVTTPEEMPVAETIELAGRLSDETTVALQAVVVNRVLPGRFTRREEEAFSALTSDAAAVRLRSALGREVREVLEGAALAVELRHNRSAHLADLRERLDPSLPIVLLPYLFTGMMGIAGTTELADALAAELTR